MIEAKPENSIGDRAYDRSVAEMSPRWSCYGVPSRNGRKRRRSSIYFWPRDIDEGLRSRNHRQQAGTTAAPLRVDKSPCRAAFDLENLQKNQKNPRYSVPLESRPLASSEKSNQRITTHSGLIHPITLGHSISPLTTRGLQVRIFLISGDRNVSIDPFASNRDRA